jgi:hypothetical protein
MKTDSGANDGKILNRLMPGCDFSTNGVVEINRDQKELD